MNNHEKPKVIAVDVDETLIVDGRLNWDLAFWLQEKKDSGYFTILWSMQGYIHAKNTAMKYGLENLFNAIIPKPGYIVDDDGWNWTMHTEVIKPDLSVIKKKKIAKRTTGKALRSARERKRSKL